MTEPQAMPQDTEVDPEPPTNEPPTDESPTDEATTDEAPADVSQEAGEEETTGDYQEAAEEGLAADYQTRMEEFDDTEASAPMTSLPTDTSKLDKSDLEINP